MSLSTNMLYLSFIILPIMSTLYYYLPACLGCCMPTESFLLILFSNVSERYVMAFYFSSVFDINKFSGNDKWV